MQNSVVSYFHHILSAPFVSQHCTWTSQVGADEQLDLLLDVTDGVQFRRLCECHPTTDDSGRPVYTGIVMMYHDSMTANEKNSNTLPVLMCGNLDRALRNVSELSVPLTMYRGSHQAFRASLGGLLKEILEQAEVQNETY